MRALFLTVALATMCESPAPVTEYDAGEASCEAAWAVVEYCPAFRLDGPDELPDSGDEPSWLVWCEAFQSSGIDKIDTGCIAAASGCSSAERCLEH